MKCPIDNSDLMMTERQGIEVDYCPKCRGIWLDRGELDKIIERSAEAEAAPQQYSEPPRQQQGYSQGQQGFAPQGYPQGQHGGNQGYQGHQGQPHRPYKKKKSIWEDILDF